jgi:hypothetical protein
MLEHKPKLIERAHVIDPETCAAICATVCALREHWVRRDAAALYTLGAALYLDAPRAETLEQFGRSGPPAGQYAAFMARCNPLLKTHFTPLYEALARSLGVLLDAEVRHAADRALPGFHIYEHAETYAAQKSHVPHFDRQYECIDWPASAAIDFATAISVTLPLQLPHPGGGLRVWDLSLQQVQAVASDEARALARHARSHRQTYVAGELVVHRGHLLHQVAPWRSTPGEARMTLQAHGLYYDEAWQLYW